MQVSVESVGSIGRRLTISLPAEQLEQAIVSRLQRLTKQVKMPGFRPGKVPMKIIEAEYGGQVIQEATGELIESSYQKALGQEGLRPAGSPKIEPKTMERGQALEYVAEFDVYPEAKKLDLKGQTIERLRCQITEADVDRTIETLRRQQITWNKVDRPAKLDDQIVIDFVGSIDGTEFAGGAAKDTPLVLGSGAMISGFEDQLIGISSGEERTIEVTFPEDYQAPELAAKKAQFVVTTKSVEEPELPEVNDEFVAKLGVENGSVEKLRSDVRDNLEREKQVRQRNVLRDHVLQALVEINDIDVPLGLIEQEINSMKQQEAQQQQSQGLAVTESANDVYEASARRRVLLGLVVGEIVREQNITADKDLVRKRVEELAAGYESPDEVIRWHYESPERIQGIQSVVLEEKVVEALLQTATIKEQDIGFQELVKTSLATN